MRELGCVRRSDAGYTDSEAQEIRAMQHSGSRRIGLYRLSRVYYADGSLCGFYDEQGQAFGGDASCASISATDRV